MMATADGWDGGRACSGRSRVMATVDSRPVSTPISS